MNHYNVIILSDFLDQLAFSLFLYNKCQITQVIHTHTNSASFHQSIVSFQQAEIDGVTDTDGTKLFVKEKMDPWVDQRGFPLVNITLTGPGTARAEQAQFLNPQDQDPPPSPFL